MNDDYPLDDVLRAWADAGEERLPAHHLDAALAEIELTPQRGARWAPVEDLLMRFQPLAAPIAIAAVLVMAIVAVALLTGPPNVGPEASPTPSPSMSSVEPTPDSEPSIASTPDPSSDEEAVRVLEASWSVPFTMTVPAAWQRHPASTDTLFVIESGARSIALTTQGQETVDGWRSFLQSSPALQPTDPVQVSVGDAPGFVVDVSLVPGGGASETTVLFRDGSTTWEIGGNAINRLWVVDVSGQTVLIVTEAGERAFDGWVGTVEAALATLTWNAGTRELDAGWSVPFMMTVPSDWQRDPASLDTVFKIDTGVETATRDIFGQWLFLYAPDGPETADERLARFTSNPQLVSTDVESVELGGASGYRLDIRLNPDDPPDSRGCPRFPSCHLITAGAGGWYILPDRATRLWIVDVGEQTVLIGTQAPEESFVEWAAQVEAAVSTVRWE